MGGYIALFVHMCLGIRRVTGENIIPLASVGPFISLILCSCFRDFADSGPKCEICVVGTFAWLSLC